MVAEGCADQSQLNEGIVEVGRQCPVAQEDDLVACFWRFVQELQELGASPDSVSGGTDRWATVQASRLEHRPVLGPLVADRRRHHHDDLARRILLRDRRSHGQRDKGLSHANVISEHNSGLAVQTPANLGGSLHLPPCIPLGQTVAAQVDVRAECPGLTHAPTSRKTFWV